MQSYHDHSQYHPSIGQGSQRSGAVVSAISSKGIGGVGGGGRGSQYDGHRRSGLFNDSDDYRRGPGAAILSHGTKTRESSSRHPFFLSASRWEPPGGRKPHPASGGGGEGGGGHRSRAQNQERENNYRRGEGQGEGRQGGGKINRQRRHSSNHARIQRDPNHRSQQQPPPRPRKNIVTPDEPAAANDAPSRRNLPATSAADNAVESMPKLDPADPVHARRIQQRRRQVLFGKNTAGYEEYVKKVPRHKRRPRTPECPATPDHLVDIPTKRWQGLMNAWRRALHKYDPPDLHLRQPSQDGITLAPRPCVTEEDRQQEEIAQAKAAGLQVAFGSMNVGREAALFGARVAGDLADDKPPQGAGRAAAGEIDVLFEEETVYRQKMMEDGDSIDNEHGRQHREGGGFLEDCESDSDDDFL